MRDEAAARRIWVGLCRWLGHRPGRAAGAESLGKTLRRVIMRGTCPTIPIEVITNLSRRLPYVSRNVGNTATLTNSAPAQAVVASSTAQLG